MPPPRVLLIGGHGKISLHLTPLLLSHPSAYHLTSLIRNSSQSSDITSLRPPNGPGTLSILTHDISQVSTPAHALPLLQESKPDYVIFSAGAGGKGGPAVTNAIDKVACIAFARATREFGSVRKFVVVSYIGSRSKPAPWWGAGDAEAFQRVNDGVLKNYHKAKLAADQAITALGREEMVVVSLRPGSLTDETEGEGRVKLGKIASTGSIRRIDVARVLVEVLEKVEKSCWLDLLQGEEDVAESVAKCVSKGVNCVEGEDVDAMVKEWVS